MGLEDEVRQLLGSEETNLEVLVKRLGEASVEHPDLKVIMVMYSEEDGYLEVGDTDLAPPYAIGMLQAAESVIMGQWFPFVEVDPEEDEVD